MDNRSADVTCLVRVPVLCLLALMLLELPRTLLTFSRDLMMGHGRLSRLGTSFLGSVITHASSSHPYSGGFYLDLSRPPQRWPLFIEVLAAAVNNDSPTRGVGISVYIHAPDAGGAGHAPSPDCPGTEHGNMHVKGKVRCSGRYIWL